MVGVDIEQYDSSSPDRYLRGLLLDKTDDDTITAFRSYLTIVPSAPVAFDEFARLVSILYSSDNLGTISNCFRYQGPCPY